MVIAPAGARSGDRPDLSALDRILIQQQCRDVSARYSHAIASGNFADLAHVFAPDGVLDVGGRQRRGPEAIAASLHGSLPYADGERARHVITNELIEVQDAHSASASAFFTLYRFNTANGPQMPSLSPMALLTAEDEYVATRAGWRLSLRRIHLAASAAPAS